MGRVFYVGIDGGFYGRPLANEFNRLIQENPGKRVGRCDAVPPGRFDKTRNGVGQAAKCAGKYAAWHGRCGQGTFDRQSRRIGQAGHGWTSKLDELFIGQGVETRPRASGYFPCCSRPAQNLAGFDHAGGIFPGTGHQRFLVIADHFSTQPGNGAVLRFGIQLAKPHRQFALDWDGPLSRLAVCIGWRSNDRIVAQGIIWGRCGLAHEFGVERFLEGSLHNLALGFGPGSGLSRQRDEGSLVADHGILDGGQAATWAADIQVAQAYTGRKLARTQAPHQRLKITFRPGLEPPGMINRQEQLSGVCRIPGQPQTWGGG